MTKAPSVQNTLSYTERLKASQMSISKVQEMATADLFDACVNHPMFFYYLTRDKRSRYLQNFAAYFNCFRELKKRQPEEVFRLMKNYYKGRILSDGKEKDVLRINFFEWLVISGVFDNALLVDIETFNDIVYENLIIKCSDNDFAGFSYETSLLLGLKLQSLLGRVNEKYDLYFEEEFIPEADASDIARYCFNQSMMLFTTDAINFC